MTNKIKLGDLIKLEYGKGLPSSKRKAGSVPVYGSNGVVGYHEEGYVNRGVVVGRKGSIGKTELVESSFWPIDTTYYVIDNPKYELRWIYYLLQTLNLSSLNRATGVPGLNRDDVYKLSVFCPPLSVQQKIGDILSSIDEAIQKTDQIINKVELLNKGIIFQLLEDSATQTVKLNTVCTKITDGTHRTPKYITEGIPFLRINDIRDDQINWGRCKYISEDEHKELVRRCKPEKGDVLLSKNGTIGITKVVDWDKEFSIFVSLCLIKPDKSKVLPEYLAEVVGSDYVMDQVRKRSKQGTVTNLHLEEIRDFDIPLPDTDRQKVVIAIIKDLKLRKVNEEITYQNLIKLKSALMHDIFNQKIVIN